MNKTIIILSISSILLVSLFLNPAMAKSPYDYKLFFAGTLEETLGHFWALEQNLDEGNAELALIHVTHPIAELYDSMSSLLEDNPEFDAILQDTLMQLQHKANTEVNREDAQAAIDEAKSIIEEARMIVVGEDLTNDVNFKARLINGLLETSKVEYMEAVSDGIIEEMAEFQDGSAFVWKSEQIFDSIESAVDVSAANNIRTSYENLWAAYDERADPSQIEDLVDSIIAEFETISGVQSEESEHMDEVFGIAYFPPPLKQIKDGTEPSKVTCTEGLELVLKKSNGLPACLKPTSVEKLIERGWAIHILPDYENENNNSEIFPMGNFEVETKLVNYDTSEGFLAMPADEGQFPGVVMIHEWWGLNDNIKEMAEKLASHGYTVLAVDLYNGNVATTSDEARQLISSFDQNLGIENMNSAALYLQENHNSATLGSIGWCFGGGQSLNLALNNENMDATVIYYGQLQTDQEVLSSISWPVLGIFAGLDQGIPKDSVNDFETSLNELAISNEIHIYPDVDHAFANPSGERYAPDESKDAWQKTLNFFNENLK